MPRQKAAGIEIGDFVGKMENQHFTVVQWLSKSEIKILNIRVKELQSIVTCRNVGAGIHQ